MTDAMRETASAFLDGEQSELELRRLIKDSDNQELRAWISRQYTVKTVLRTDRAAVCPAGVQTAIFAALADEASHSGAAGVRAVPVWWRPVAGFAVAASVCAAVVIGMGGTSDMRPEASVQTVATAADTLPELGPTRSVSALGGANLRTVGFGASASINGAVEANTRTAERLNFYLRQHAERASLNNSQGMLPMARVVEFRDE